MENEEENLDDGLVQSSTGTSRCRTLLNHSSNVKRSKTSSVWNYFKVDKDENGEERASYMKCSKSYAHTLTSGTSNLIHHQINCSESLDTERRVAKIDDKVAREKFSRVIIRQNLPFLCVEYEEFRDYLKYLYPDYKCYTRNTAAADVIKTWEKEKKILKAELEKIPSRVCLTSDC
uniref:Zinc finger BED domain-containing protein DAYSLEEPER n=1 Tax=Noccaea caerulescens TaxID=107243 RepID=A0A1J3GMA8_NOCCA